MAVAFAACLGDDATDRVGEDSESLGPDGEPPAAALALPPGGIIDTQPDSGWTEGSFTVNHNGAAEYHLPLWVPDGRAGLQPELALHYNSQSGNGLVGVGWSLAAGLSSIVPCARTFAEDGRAESPQHWSAGDAYCLDGQRLRPTDNEWSEEQDYRTERDSFARVRAYSSGGIDPPLPPDYFKVWTKDGRIMTFDAVVRAFALSGQDPEDPSFARSLHRQTAELFRLPAAWLLSKIEDRNGNAIAIQYETIESNDENQWSVETVPRFITYGPDRTVELQYEDRADKVNTFHAGDEEGLYGGGFHTELARRLLNIRVSAGTDVLREYRLRYRDDGITGRSKLENVSECDGADGAEPAVCLRSLEFDWTLGSTTVFQEINLTDVTDVALQAWEKRYFIPGDIDGDGRDDLLYYLPGQEWTIRFSTGSGFTAPQSAGLPVFGLLSRDPRVRPIDVDRDGRMDVMVEEGEIIGDVTVFSLYRSTGSRAPGSTYEHVFTDPAFFHQFRQDFHFEGLWHGFFADIDGNGLPDYLGPFFQDLDDDEPGSHLRWRYSLNLGDTFGSFASGPTMPGPIDVLGEDVPDTYQIRAMSSDGPRARLLAWSGPQSGYSRLAFEEGELSSGGDALNLPFLRSPENDDRRNLHFADLNGDGLEDAVYPCTGMKVQLSSGVGFSELIDGPSETLPCPEPADDNLRVRVVDFTGDGNDDILLLDKEDPNDNTGQGVQVFTWVGRGFRRWATNIPTVAVDGSNPIGAVQPLDFDGDGLMDIAQVWRATPEISSSFLRIHRRIGDIPDKLIRVNVANLGPRVEIEYTTLADSAVHTPGTQNCSYPIMCPRRGGSIVSRHWMANGMTTGSPLHEYTHRYRSARADLGGRGWLGFEEHETRDLERADAGTTAFFDNHTREEISLADGATAYVYPFAGQPYKVLRTITSGTVDGLPVTYEHLTETRFVFRPGATPGTWVKRLENTTVSDRERIGEGDWTRLHFRATDFEEYDAFENVRQAATVLGATGGGTTSDRVDVAEYDNDTTNWLIGLPTTRTTTSCTRPDNRCQTRNTSFDHDSSGNLEEVIVEPGDQELRLTTTIAYRGFGNIESVTSSDAAGETRTTSFTYDGQDLYPRTTTNALGHTSSVTMHPGLGVALDSEDANGLVPATMKYDRFGRLREVNFADGHFERYFTFGPLAQLTVTPDGSGATITARTTILDVLARPIETRVPAFDGGLSAVRTTYDRLGRVATVSRPFLSGTGAPLQNTVYSYDSRHRLLTMVEPGSPDAVTTRHEYIGRETHTHDGRDNHSYVVERLDGLIEARFEDDPNSSNWLKTSFDYGPFGLLRATVAADDTVQSVQYDARGRRIQHVDPSAGTTTSVYNAFGELRHETNGHGEVTDVQIHDQLGRPWRINSPAGLTTLSWDERGNLGRLDVAAQNDTNGHYIITRFSYDAIGRNWRTSWEIDNDSFFEVDAGFDSIGRLASITYPRIPFEPEPLAPARLKVNYTYHPAGYLESATDAAAGTVYWRADSRQADGQLTQETFGNGVVGIREYQPETGLLETLTTDGPGGLLDQIGYGYDENRNVSLRDDVVGSGARSQRFTYDTLDRLDIWSHQRADGSDLVTTVFEHDRVGNLLNETVIGRTGRNVSYRYGQNGAPRHALTMRNGQSYSYDGAGRRIAGAALTSITYNRKNLPIRLQRSGGGTTEFAYDAAGARVLKQTATTTQLSIAGLFDRQLGNQIRNQHYIMADGREVAQVALIQQAPEGPVTDTEIRYIHSDGQGSSALVTSEAGTTVAELFYDPYGRRTDRNYDPLAGMVPVRPGYTGHRHDDELALIDMKGRVYDIDARRFLTPDPFIQAPLFSQSHNRYSYVWNNPATFIDPSGFNCQAENVEKCRDGNGAGGLDWGTVKKAAAWADDHLDEVDDAVRGFFSDLFGGGSSQAVPTSDDNNPTDIVSTGSGGGAGIPINAGQDFWWPVALGVPGAELTSDPEPFVMPDWISGLQRGLAGMGRYAAWSHGPGAAGAWSTAVDSMTSGALAVDRLAGFVPFGGTLYYAAQGRWREAGASALTDVIAFGAARALRAGGVGSSYVYQLVDDAGEAVYYGVAGDPAVRLGRHALQPPGPFRGMQVISAPLPPPQALILETSLIHQARAEGRFIYNIADTSLSPPVPIDVPPTIVPTQTLLNPKLYPRR